MTLPKIKHLAKGSYQADLLTGREPWSGAGLRGLARDFSGSYARSRANLVDRIQADLPEGWTVSVPLVLNKDRRRERRLVLTFQGQSYDYFLKTQLLSGPCCP